VQSLPLPSLTVIVSKDELPPDPTRQVSVFEGRAPPSPTVTEIDVPGVTANVVFSIASPPPLSTP